MDSYSCHTAYRDRVDSDVRQKTGPEKMERSVESEHTLRNSDAVEMVNEEDETVKCIFNW